MSASIPAAFQDLFRKKSLAYLSLALEDGSMIVNPVWCDFDGTHVLINSAQGRLKDRLMRRKPKATLCIADPENSQRYLQVRGHVAEVTTDGADGFVDALARRYMGVERYPHRKPGEVRVTYKIVPDNVSTYGE